VALLIAMTLVVAGATSAATTAVVLRLHMPTHHQAHDATSELLRHHDFTKTPPKSWKFE
jgi:hypothetical protein